MQKHAPPFNVSHFSINVDDMDRAQKFYAGIFGWTFTPWGPPGFFLINSGDGIHGAIQKRQVPLSDNEGIRGFECSISVEDVDETMAKALELGAKTIYPKSTIPTVGDIAVFWDTEGNKVSIAKYDDNAI